MSLELSLIPFNHRINNPSQVFRGSTLGRRRWAQLRRIVLKATGDGGGGSVRNVHTVCLEQPGLSLARFVIRLDRFASFSVSAQNLRYHHTVDKDD